MQRNSITFIIGVSILVLGITAVGWIFRKNIVGYVLPPKISLDILFSHHQLATDLSLSIFKDRLSGSDIFLMEYPEWSAEFEEDLNSISQGALSPQQFFSKRQVPEEIVKNTFQFLELQLNALYRSGVFVTSIDLPAGYYLANEIKQYVPVVNQIQLYSDFFETLKSEREKYQYFTNLQIQRQQYMVDRFVELAEKIKNKQFSKVKEKSEIRIFFLLGSNHAMVYDLLKNKGVNVTKEFAHTPYTYDYAGEITTKFIAGENMSDELLADGLLETELSNLFGLQWIHNQEKYARLMRNIASRFTFEDIKKIFTTMAQSQNPHSMFQELFTDLAKEKNIVIPETRE